MSDLSTIYGNKKAVPIFYGTAFLLSEFGIQRKIITVF